MSPTSDEVIAVRIVPTEPQMKTWQFIGLYVIGAALGWILTEGAERYEGRQRAAERRQQLKAWADWTRTAGGLAGPPQANSDGLWDCPRCTDAVLDLPAHLQQCKG